MIIWDGVGAALISAVVALAVSIVFRWLDRRSVRWIVTGEAHREYNSGKPSGRVRIELDVHNAGDADAYDVRVRRCNGGTYPSWTTFEAAKVPSGGSFHVRFVCAPETWESAWLEPIARSSPVSRQKLKTDRRVILRSITGPSADMPPRLSTAQRTADGYGADLPEEDGGRSR